MRRIAAVMLVLLIASRGSAQADHDDPRIAKSIDFVRAGLVDAGQAQFESDLAALPAAGPEGARQRGDLLMTFGLAEWSHGQNANNCPIVRRGIDAIRRASLTYRGGLPDAADTATTFVSYGDVLRELSPGDPPREADAAYRQALAIRTKGAGPGAATTLAAATLLAELDTLPSRLRGDAARADATIAAMGQALAALGPSGDTNAAGIAMRARLAIVSAYFASARPDQAMAALADAAANADRPDSDAGVWFLMLGIGLRERLDLSGQHDAAAAVARAYPRLAAASLPLHCGLTQAAVTRRSGRGS